MLPAVLRASPLPVKLSHRLGLTAELFRLVSTTVETGLSFTGIETLIDQLQRNEHAIAQQSYFLHCEAWSAAERQRRAVVLRPGIARFFPPAVASGISSIGGQQGTGVAQGGIGQFLQPPAAVASSFGGTASALGQHGSAQPLRSPAAGIGSRQEADCRKVYPQFSRGLSFICE